MSEKFTLFYGGYFSQWYRSSPDQFVIDGVTYNCAEQFMMAEKARLFGDKESLERIMRENHPKDQKAIGRQVKDFNVEKWDAISRNCVYLGNYAKFTQNKGLLLELMSTEGTTLVEASPTDRIWGIGRSMDDPLAYDKNQWLGKNWLGQVLTKLRDNIKLGIERVETDWE